MIEKCILFLNLFFYAIYDMIDVNELLAEIW